MKDHLLSLARAESDPGKRLNIVREYTQALILRSLQEAGAFASLAFLGGTALRFLHGLRRFSEDLDFSLERAVEFKDLEAYARAVRRDLNAAGYDVEGVVRTGRTVQSAWLKFPGLPYDTGLSAMPDEKLAVRIELDTNPPSGATFESRLVTRHFPIAFRAHDLPSCLAGKVHAILARGHTKGRDLFDLSWYLTHPSRPGPNLELLRNALAQTEWSGAAVTSDSWKSILIEKVETLDWPSVVQDVEPFLEDPGDRQLMDRDLLMKELGR